MGRISFSPGPVSYVHKSMCFDIEKPKFHVGEKGNGLEQFNTANKTASDAFVVKRITELLIPGIESKRHLVLIGSEA